MKSSREARSYPIVYSLSISFPETRFDRAATGYGSGQCFIAAIMKHVIRRFEVVPQNILSADFVELDGMRISNFGQRWITPQQLRNTFEPPAAALHESSGDGIPVSTVGVRYTAPGIHLHIPGGGRGPSMAEDIQGFTISEYSPFVRSVKVTGSSVRLRQNHPCFPVNSATSSPS